MLQRSRRILALLGAALMVGTACGGGAGTSPAPATSGAAATSAAAFKLTRAAEFVISTSPGGGSDQIARFIQGVIQKHSFMEQALQPVNKEGGSGAVAYNYVFDKKGDPHYIMITLNSFFLTAAIQKLPYKATDFTPIALLAFDPFFLWVNADSPIKDVKDFIAAAQKDSLTVSGTGSKQEDETLFSAIRKAANTKPFNYVPESGGSKVAAALAGHQGGVVATVNNPSEGLPLMQGASPKVRPLCAFLDKAPTEDPFKNLPTCQSAGLDVKPYFNMRAIFAAPGISKEATAYWVDLFKKVSDSDEWKGYVKENVLQAQFTTGDDLVKIVKDLDDLHRQIAQENGWVK
jgi:putative tricarboxylic transport membrane protein